MNIAVGKFGKSILFDEKKWGSIGGDCEAPVYYENLFHNNPEWTFYIIGRNDYDRLDKSTRDRINKHGNVVNIWDGFKEWKKTADYPDKHKAMNYPLDYFKDNKIKIDKGLFIAGPIGTSNCAGRTTKMAEPDVFTSPIEMVLNYASPMVLFLNETNIPYSLVVNDPRYWPTMAKDLFNLPKDVLSQFDEESIQKTKKSYTDPAQVEHKCPMRYAAMETMFLIGKDRPKKKKGLGGFMKKKDAKVEKDVSFMIVLNEGSPSRYKLLEESILRDMSDVEIYGKWTHELTENDERFKGSMPFHDLQKRLQRVKYSYCIPIKKGWVTMKFWELALAGIIPFVHPTYDEQDHLKLPDILRVKNSKELSDNIKFLDDNPLEYKSLKNTIDSMLKTEYYNGIHLNNITVDSLNSI